MPGGVPQEGARPRIIEVEPACLALAPRIPPACHRGRPWSGGRPERDHQARPVVLALAGVEDLLGAAAVLDLVADEEAVVAVVVELVRLAGDGPDDPVLARGGAGGV